MVAAHPSNPTATAAESAQVLLESGVTDNHIEEYLDLDGSAVTTSELRAWYGFAACLDPISYCGVAVFLPLLIQTLAAGNGFTTENHSVRCDTSVDNYSCVVRVGAGWVDTTSFFFYLVVISAVAQTLLFVAIGALADHGAWRKKLMLSFGGVAAVIGVLFPVVTRNDEFWLSSIFFVILNIAIGMAWVFVYAYLPFLSRNHVDYLILKQDQTVTQEHLALKLDQITNRISSHAFMWMYGGTFSMLILLVIILVAYTPINLPSSYSINVGIFFCGLCMFWGIWVAHRWLRERPGPPFPVGMNPITYSTKKVATSLCKVRELKNLFLFLIGWFMTSDAFNTLATSAVLLATQLLNFSTKGVLVIAVEAPVLAILGAFAWNQVHVRFHLRTKTLLLIQVFIYAFVCAFISLGINAAIPFGWKHSAEVYIYAGTHGFMLGAIQSTCRSLFVSLLPRGLESSFHSLYLLCDKGSSWIGPLIVAVINGSGCDKRVTFLFLAVQFAVGLGCFALVDAEAGALEGKRYGEAHWQALGEIVQPKISS